MSSIAERTMLETLAEIEADLVAARSDGDATAVAELEAMRDRLAQASREHAELMAEHAAKLEQAEKLTPATEENDNGAE